MNREQFVLAALAPAHGAPHSPVQVQKLLFVLDTNMRNVVGGPHFNFEPYHYGPFDKDVYAVMGALAAQGLAEIAPEPACRWDTYRLTAQGQQEGESLLQTLPCKARTYVTTISDFVRSLSFAQLVAAVYKAYPDMKINSVFQE
jgi:hypothetical protein